jgi:hypothetical protein
MIIAGAWRDDFAVSTGKLTPDIKTYGQGVKHASLKSQTPSKASEIQTDRKFLSVCSRKSFRP